MTTPHPHKDILIAIANGLPISEIEVRRSTWATWQPFRDYVYDIFSCPNNWQIRINQKTVMFNGVELPAPLMEKPAKYQTVYLTDPANSYFYAPYVCNDWDNFLEKKLKQGLLHANKENAIAWANAMIPFSQTN